MGLSHPIVDPSNPTGGTQPPRSRPPPQGVPCRFPSVSSPMDSSRNSIQGTTTIDLPANAIPCGPLSTTVRDHRKGRRDRVRIQLQLADGGQMDHMIPHVAAAAIRRVSRSSCPFWSSTTVDDRRDMSSSAFWQRSYYPLRSLLRSMVQCAPFRNAACHRTQRRSMFA